MKTGTESDSFRKPWRIIVDSKVLTMESSPTRTFWISSGLWVYHLMKKTSVSMFLRPTQKNRGDRVNRAEAEGNLKDPERTTKNNNNRWQEILSKKPHKIHWGTKFPLQRSHLLGLQEAILRIRMSSLKLPKEQVGSQVFQRVLRWFWTESPKDSHQKAQKGFLLLKNPSGLLILTKIHSSAYSNLKK